MVAFIHAEDDGETGMSNPPFWLRLWRREFRCCGGCFFGLGGGGGGGVACRREVVKVAGGGVGGGTALEGRERGHAGGEAIAVPASVSMVVAGLVLLCLSSITIPGWDPTYDSGSA